VDANVRIVPTAIEGAVMLETDPVQDRRGAFARLFCARELAPVIGEREIVQINHSVTRAVGAVRGMHFQRAPHAEMKIVRCLRGRVFDVAVDLRAGSPTLLRWVSCELSASNHRSLVVPEGCAHGFQVLEPDSELLYLHTAYYSREAEGGIRHDDARVGIAWPLAATDLSERDRGHPLITADFAGLAA
jgi:dTDP-4-dehydrorhamnose 3,5-epimerase